MTSYICLINFIIYAFYTNIHLVYIIMYITDSYIFYYVMKLTFHVSIYILLPIRNTWNHVYLFFRFIKFPITENSPHQRNFHITGHEEEELDTCFCCDWSSDCSRFIYDYRVDYILKSLQVNSLHVDLCCMLTYVCIHLPHRDYCLGLQQH